MCLLLIRLEEERLARQRRKREPLKKEITQPKRTEVTLNPSISRVHPIVRVPHYCRLEEERLARQRRKREPLKKEITQSKRTEAESSSGAGSSVGRSNPAFGRRASRPTSPDGLDGTILQTATPTQVGTTTTTTTNSNLTRQKNRQIENGDQTFGRRASRPASPNGLDAPAQIQTATPTQVTTTTTSSNYTILLQTAD